MLRQSTFASQESETGASPKARAITARFVALALTFGLALAGADLASGESGFFPVLGAGWAAPRGHNISSIYSSGPILGGGLGFQWSPKLSAQLRLDWFSESGRPTAPPFVDSPSTDLRWIPITLRFEYAHGEGADQLLLLAGVGLWVGREQFDYSLIGANRKVSAGTTQPAGSLGVGYLARRGSMSYRLIGRWMASTGHRETLRGNTTVKTGERVTVSLLTLGLEITP